jgi:hypothetical protein
MKYRIVEIPDSPAAYPDVLIVRKYLRVCVRVCVRVRDCVRD